MSSYADTIDLADVARTLRRGWRTIAITTVVGIAAAGLLVAFGPRRFTGKSSVLIQESSAGSSLLDKLGVGGGNAGGALIGMGARSPIETDLQVLKSRDLAGKVVDSLLLQARVRSPGSNPPSAYIASIAAPGNFKPQTFTFEPASNGTIVVRGDDFQAEGRAGSPIRLPLGEIVLKPRVTPPLLKLKVYDREDAITDFQDHLTVEKAGGDVASIAFRAPDSLTAAQVANALVEVYFARRHTTDRGINQHRAEFLALQVDSVGRVLKATARALRVQQQRTGSLDPEIDARLGIEANGKLRETQTDVQMELGAIDRMLSQVASGGMSTREIAAYPAFIKSSGVSQLLAQLSALDVEQQKVLATRTSADPQAQALAKSIRGIEDQLVPIARAYRASLVAEKAGIDRVLDSTQASIAALPAAAEYTQSLQADVKRQQEIYTALQAQLIEARLATIGEGGDVHRLDVAQPPRKVSFPAPTATLAIGSFGGLLLGLALALVGAAFGRYVHDPLDIERRAGVPAMQLEAGAPLLVGSEAPRTVLLVPLDNWTDTAGIALRLVRTGTSRALNPVILDLAGTPGTSDGQALTLAGDGVSASISRLEQQHGMVIVRLPGMASDMAAAALDASRPVLLAATAGRVDRMRLREAVQTLERLSVPCLGVVLSRAEEGKLRRV